MRNLEQSERLERLRRYSDDLHAMMADGSFYRKSYLERRKLIRRVKKLYNRLAGSSPYLKPVVTAAGVLALNTACFGPFSENPIVLPDNRTGGSDDPGAQVGAPV